MNKWHAIYAERERVAKRRERIAAARLAAKIDAMPWWWCPMCFAIMRWRNEHRRRPFGGDMGGCGYQPSDMSPWQENAYRHWEDARE